MNFLILISTTVLISCVYAQVSLPPGYKEKYPYYYKYSKKVRQARDVTWDKNVGNGKVFGTLGSDDQGLFGKGGYKQEIFNDHRGKLEGQAYGTRVLGPNGGSSDFGGRLDWADKNAKAGLDVNRQIGGGTRVTGTGSGVWNLDKNTKLSAGGAVSQTLGKGKPDVGFQAQFQKDF